MALAKITILGFNSYYSSRNDDLFKNLDLPEGIDKDTLVANILNDAAEFELLYSNPEYMRDLIGIWSKKHYWTFNKWIELYNEEYDPLHNYDRHEVWTDTSTKTGTEEDAYSNTTSAEATTEDEATTTNKVSAFDSNTLQTDTESHSEGSVTNGSSGSNEGSNTKTFDTTDSATRTGRAYGNIGVTTSQQMWRDQYELVKINLYQAITDLFIEEFCVAVYV